MFQTQPRRERRRHHGVVRVSILTLAVGLASWPGVSFGAPQSPASFNGLFALAESRQADQDLIHEAIDRATKGMFFAIRGIARSRLRKETDLPQTLTFAIDGGEATTTFDGERSYTALMNGPAVDVVVPDGENVALSYHYADGVFTTVFAAKDGARRDDYRLSPDGRLLHVSVTISSPRLPQPVQYSLTYQRLR